MKTTLTSENPPDVTIINRTDADVIIQNIKKELRTWKTKNYLYNTLVGVLGTVAILGSVIVSVYLDTRSEILTAERLKLIAIASTVSLSILSAFNIISRTNNYSSAYDLMQVALFKYNARLIGLSTLIEAYDKANKIIGGIDFNFDKNFNAAAPSKTKVSVDTADEIEGREAESQSQPELAARKNAAAAPPEKTDPSAQKTVAAPPTGKSLPGTANENSPVPPTAAEPEPGKSEAIIHTDDVSVLVSGK